MRGRIALQVVAIACHGCEFECVLELQPEKVFAYPATARHDLAWSENNSLCSSLTDPAGP